MNTFELEVFAEQRMRDRLQEAERERLVRECRSGSPARARRPGWSVDTLRRLGGAVRSTFSAGPWLAGSRSALHRSRE